jgi:hypothetical protein
MKATDQVGAVDVGGREDVEQLASGGLAEGGYDARADALEGFR